MLFRSLDLLRAAGDRAAVTLGLSQSPIVLTGNSVRAIDFAGLINLGAGIELEIVPKFLGSSEPGWREDFFFLAMLSRHGHLLESNRLRALSTTSGDLATLIGRALIRMYWDHHRQPIRTYRRRVEFDYAIDGDFEPEDLLRPDTDGYSQTVVRYGRENEFNGVIKAATQQLVPIVRDLETRAMLERISSLLGTQSKAIRPRLKRLPSRARRWQTTVELAVDILKGFGLTYNLGQSVAPGFLLNTWRVWEDVLTIALRAAVGSEATQRQPSFGFGVRSRFVDAAWMSDRDITVRPDIALSDATLSPPQILIDAKYKGRVDHGQQRVSEADIYEAFAFSTASGIKRLFLVYPKVALQPAGLLGATTMIERVIINDCEVSALETEVRGIAGHAGLRKFADGLVSGIKAVTT